MVGGAGGGGLTGLLPPGPCLLSLLSLLAARGFLFQGFLRGEFLGALIEVCALWPDAAFVGVEGGFGSVFFGECTETLSMAVLGWSGLPEGASLLSVLVGVSLLLSLGAVSSLLSTFSTVILGVITLLTLFSLAVMSLVLVDTSELTSAIFHFFRLCVFQVYIVTLPNTIIAWKNALYLCWACFLYL